MNTYPIELIPAIIKGSRPSQYEGESFTALEYVSKVAAKINECINEYNGFVDEIIKQFENFKNGEVTDRDIFERRIEQMIVDFKAVIQLKYKEQDTVIANAISEMIDSLPDNISKAISNMYSKGEFDTIVYNSVANLKKDFDSIVNNTNNFQNTINNSFVNFVNNMELFRSSTTAEFERLEEEINVKFDGFVADSSAADMKTSVYDTTKNGVVDNAEKLGGNPPEYYAQQQELSSLTTTVNAMSTAANSVLSQINTIQATVSENTANVTRAVNKANEAITVANKKLGLTEQAQDSLKLNGKSASYYATASDAINTYYHSKSNTVHNIVGTGDNIKFVANANYKKGDTFAVNDTPVTAVTSNGEPLDDRFFTTGNMVVCYLNGTVLNFSNGGAGSILNFSVVASSTQPASPSENLIWVKSENEVTGFKLVNNSNNYNADSEGYVLIEFEASSDGEVNTFNALKKNGICIKINKVKQFVDNEWSSKDAYIYMRDEWFKFSESKFILVTSSTLDENVTLNIASKGTGSTTTVGTSCKTKANTGSYFGHNVSLFNKDIRGFNKLSISVDLNGTGASGGTGYSLSGVIAGTLEQLQGVKFKAYNELELNGCYTVHSFTPKSTDAITVEDIDLPSFNAVAEPVYLAVYVTTYNGAEREMIITECTIS